MLHFLCKRSDLPPAGEAREFACADKTLCIANHNSVFTAMDNVCPHRGGPLGQGMIERGKLVCPWHGWAFDLTTGAATHDPRSRATVYSLHLDGDDVAVDF
ncbi:MAG TPA: Rieske (2Fe-2S) protein [Terriglobales bacterium]